MTTSDDDPLVARLRAADPARRLAVGESELRLLLDRSLAETPRRRRRAPWIAGALLALVALGASSPAIAAGVRQFVAQTGWVGASPNPPGVGVQNAPSTESDESEWIDVLAPDFVDYSVSVLPTEVSVPPGYDLGAFARVVATSQQASFPGAGTVQATGIRSNFESHARCLWIDDWLAAHATGDTARADAAAAVLEESAAWPATVATDGGGIVEAYRAVAAAAAAGDRAPVASEFDVNCPAIPDGMRE